MTDHPLDMDPAPRQMPVMSVVGLAAFTLAIIIFGLTQWQNSKALAKIEHVQDQQVAFTQARAPATRSSLCNLLHVAVAVIQPSTPERRHAIAVLKQNTQALECPAEIVELPPDIPRNPP